MRPGGESQNLVLYSKTDCPLCRQAEHLISRALPEYPVQVIDIIGNRDLEDRFVFRIPVLASGQQVLAEGQITHSDIMNIRRFLAKNQAINPELTGRNIRGSKSE